jgi:hypothetical protein
MGKHHFCAVVVAGSVFAACGGNDAKPDALIKIPDAAIDAKIFLDAPPPVYDLSCLGNPVLTTATATITLSGTVSEIGFDVATMMPTMTPLVGATVDACKLNCTGAANKLDTVTSIAGGVFTTAAIATNPANHSLDGYLRINNTGDRQTFIYPPEPFRADQANIPVFTFPNTLIDTLVQFGLITQSPGNAILGIALVDCAGTPISDAANVTLSIKQGGVDVPGTTVIDASQFSPMAGGGYIVTQVPPAVTVVGASYKSMPFLSVTVTTVATSTIQTLLRPGGYP